MGDTAMCINPKTLKPAFTGKKVIVPLVGRTIPVIEDEYVDIEFRYRLFKSNSSS